MFINVSRKSGGRLHEPFEDAVPAEQPTLLQRLMYAHLNKLGYSPRDLATLLYFADEQEFREQFLKEKRLRLV